MGGVRIPFLSVDNDTCLKPVGCRAMQEKRQLVQKGENTARLINLPHAKKEEEAPPPSFLQLVTPLKLPEQTELFLSGGEGRRYFTMD